MQIPEELLAVHVDGLTHSFSRSADGRAPSFHGGPLDRAVKGRAFGPARLHHLATLAGSLFEAQGAGFSLPLVHGLRFDGCKLEYRFTASEIEVLDISPEMSSADWPYFDYPPVLPCLPIAAAAPVRETWSSFAARFPNLPAGQPAELVAVMPPSFHTGHSLWGRAGDLAGACVVFECDLAARRLRSCTVCG